MSSTQMLINSTYPRVDTTFKEIRNKQENLDFACIDGASKVVAYGASLIAAVYMLA